MNHMNYESYISDFQNDDFIKKTQLYTKEKIDRKSIKQLRKLQPREPGSIIIELLF